MYKFSGFLDLLKGPLKIISQNGKLIAITAAIYLILYSISFILYTSSANPFIIDSTLKLFALISAQPGTPEYTKLLAAIREDIGIFLGLEIVYVVFSFFVLTFVQTAIILIASSYYSGNNLSLKELIKKVSSTWTRPLVTSFYVQLIALGYMSIFFWPFFMIPSLTLFDHPIILMSVLIFFAILLITYYLHISVVWILGVVVSVFEDTYGLSALGKAKELVKGKRVDGFLLNLICTLVLVVIFMVGFKLSPVMPIVAGLIQVICIGVVSMFQFMVYSVYYYKCKNNMMISGGSIYTQIPHAPVVDENIP